MTKNKKQDNKYKILNTIFGVMGIALLVIAGTSTFFALKTNEHSAEETRVIEMKDFFVNYVLSNWCNSVDNGKGNWCHMEEIGLSKDGDLYAKFTHNVIDPVTNIVIESTPHTMYFQYYNPDNDQPSIYQYAIAIGD